MFYTIYKTTNILNGKFYIGKHQTNNLDDDYMGSGKLLKRAVKKYGQENFVKEIICVYDNEKLMNLAEKILVVCDPEISYNLCSGGKGGWGYVNRTLLNAGFRNMSREQRSKSGRIGGLKSSKNPDCINHLINAAYIKLGHGPFLGKKHSEETKEKLRKSKNKGPENSQYGTCWITNGNENKKIKNDSLSQYLELGYKKGRKQKCL